MGFRNLVTRMLAAPAAPKARSGTGAKTSAAGPVVAWSGIGQPRWTPRRYENLAEAGFRKNVIAYRCVMQVAVASSAVPWLLYNDQGEELDQHPLLDLLRHPNPLQDGTAFLESVYAHLEIAGNAYIEAVRPRDGDAPVELYVLRPDRMKVVPGPAGLPQAYQYSVNGQTTVWAADPITGASNILHLKQFHPLDDWYGMAPLEAAQISVDQHNAAGAWNQALLNHGARPSGALVFAPKDGPATLTDDQVNRLREELSQVYQGSRNAGRPLILEGGLDWREMSLSPKDMDWLAGRNVAARDIALAFGVPGQLVGIPDAQTYANMAEARLALYEETVLPLVTRVIAGFDHWLAPMFGNNLCLDFDPDEVSALAARRDLQWSKLQSTTFLTINEKRHAVGYAPIDGGDVLDTGKPPQSSPPANPASAAPQNFAPSQMLVPSAFTAPAPDGPNAWSSTGKFNPNHDDLGRFTFGEGGEDDNGQPDDSGGNGGDNASDTSLISSPDLPKPSDRGVQVVDASGRIGGQPNTGKKPDVLPKISVPGPNGQPVNQSNIFVGGAGDHDITGNVEDSTSLHKYVYGDNYYAMHGENEDINQQIDNLPQGRTINLIGHSLGGNTAAEVAVNNPGRINVLVTVDPVGPVASNHPEFSQIRNSVTEWVDVNTTDDSHSSTIDDIFNGNFIAGVGGAWNDGPKDFAHVYIEAPLNHAQFDRAMRSARSVDGKTPVQILNGNK